MSQFPPCFDWIMSWEDAGKTYAAVMDNNGAEVISGINQKSWPSDFAYINSILQPQRGPAVASFYQNRYWTPMQAGGINSQDLANRFVDAGVNMGSGTAVKLLQQAINLLHANTVTVDGGIGPLTLAATNECDPDSILAAFRQVRGDYYRAIAAANPADSVYLLVWLKRAEA